MGVAAKNLRRTGFIAVTTVVALLPCSAQTKKEPTLTAVAAPVVRDRLIQSKLPPGKTLVTATDGELLDAVCKAVKQSPADLAFIVTTAARARQRLQMDIFCRAVRCASERGSLNCTLVSNILNQWTREQPDKASHLLELALPCAPTCLGGLTGAGSGHEGADHKARRREPAAAPKEGLQAEPEFTEQTTPPPTRPRAQADLIAATPTPAKKDGKSKAEPPSKGEFPFPPPRASAFEEIPRELIVDGKAHPLLRDAEGALASAFLRCGYGEKSYHPIPDGFAMASRIEQISADGAPAADRWSLEVSPISEYSLEGYLKALFYARPGRYRVIVFVVTNHPFHQTDVKVDREEASAWPSHGLNQLPKEIGDLEYSDDYTCTALIYEFKLSGNGKTEFVEPSQITGRTHLEKAGILAALAHPTP
jgi:hypothetical protein